MILTEEEAKTKWCPESWGGRRVEDNDRARCIASGCCMWRWLEGEFKKVSTEVWIPKGYCGKAGRP